MSFGQATRSTGSRIWKLKAMWTALQEVSWVISLAGLMVAAATNEASAQFSSRGPLADSVFSLRLVESDSLYIGQPAGLLISPATGDFYVADAFSSRLIRFGRDGRPINVLGRKGRGPGEFIIPTPLLVSDSLLFVSDNQQLRLQVLHATNGSVISNHLYSGVLYSAAQNMDGVWLGLNDRPNQAGVVLFDGGSHASGGLLPWPHAYHESVRLPAIYDAVYVDVWGDTVVAAYQGSDDLMLIAGGTDVERITVPAVRRRGAASAVGANLDDGSIAAAFARLSAVFGVGRLSGGGIAVVHFDQDLMDGYVNVSVEVFLSVVSADRAETCPDHHVISTTYAQPSIAFRGDSLFVLSQHITDSDTQSWVTAYKIFGDACRESVPLHD
jgi:hypothetical protein